MPSRILANRLLPSLPLYRAVTDITPRTFPLSIRLAPRRLKTGGEGIPTGEAKAGPGPNQAQLPHVSEEAAATSKIQGEKGPDLEQGTPVQEVKESSSCPRCAHHLTVMGIGA